MNYQIIPASLAYHVMDAYRHEAEAILDALITVSV